MEEPEVLDLLAESSLLPELHEYNGTLKGDICGSPGHFGGIAVPAFPALLREG